MHYKGSKKNRIDTTIHDLPLEVFYEGIFSYLTDVDILNFGETGNKKFRVIADDYLKCKHTLKIILDSVNINISSKWQVSAFSRLQSKLFDH